MRHVREELLDAVDGDETAATEVVQWLYRINDEHSIEIDDKVIYPSLPWLLDALGPDLR